MPRTERERERKVASKGMQRVKYLINGGQYIFVLMANGSSTNMEAEDSCALHVSFIRLLCAPKMPCHWNSKLTNCPHTRISSTRFHIILNSRTCRFINQSRDTNKIPLCFHRCHHPSTRAILPSQSLANSCVLLGDNVDVCINRNFFFFQWKTVICYALKSKNRPKK